MATQLKQAVSAGWLCERIGLTLIGPDRDIRRVCTLDTLDEGGLSFVLPGKEVGHARRGTVIALKDVSANGISVLGSADPRYDFIRAQYLLASSPGFERAGTPAQIHPRARIHPEAVIERDRQNRPIRMVHLGGVLIGDPVEVGALSTVVQGALADTVIEDHVKINDHVHIAHNCRIGEGTIIGGAAYLSGSIRVGRNCWIAPNSSIRQKLTIGEEAIVGIGAVVVRNVEARSTVYGNPARKAAAAADHSPSGVVPVHHEK